MTRKKSKIAHAPKRRGDGPRIVYEYLREEIIALRLPAGARIEEQSIVEHLGISRTPVRQALMRMAAEGLIEQLPNRGARVPPLDLEEVRAFFEAFEIMLKTANHLAAKRRTDLDLFHIKKNQAEYETAVKQRGIKGIIDANERFHLSITQAAHNSHLVRLVGDLLTRAVRLDGIWYSRPHSTAFTENIDRSLREHKLIVQAIERGDVGEAERLALVHNQSFREPFTKFLAESDAEHISV